MDRKQELIFDLQAARDDLNAAIENQNNALVEMEEAKKRYNRLHSVIKGKFDSFHRAKDTFNEYMEGNQ